MRHVVTLLILGLLSACNMTGVGGPPVETREAAMARFDLTKDEEASLLGLLDIVETGITESNKVGVLTGCGDLDKAVTQALTNLPESSANRLPENRRVAFCMAATLVATIPEAVNEVGMASVYRPEERCQNADRFHRILCAVLIRS